MLSAEPRLDMAPLNYLVQPPPPEEKEETPSTSTPERVEDVAGIATAHQSPPSQENWESKKAVIKTMYMDQNMNLNEVVERMRTSHDFRAT